jgi:hypothetical protein
MYQKSWSVIHKHACLRCSIGAERLIMWLYNSAQRAVCHTAHCLCVSLLVALWRFKVVTAGKCSTLFLSLFLVCFCVHFFLISPNIAARWLASLLCTRSTRLQCWLSWQMCPVFLVLDWTWFRIHKDYCRDVTSSLLINQLNVLNDYSVDTSKLWADSEAFSNPKEVLRYIKSEAVHPFVVMLSCCHVVMLLSCSLAHHNILTIGTGQSSPRDDTCSAADLTVPIALLWRQQTVQVNQ